MADCGVGTELLELRRELAIRGRFPLSEFHAKNDKQRIRDLVFDVLRRANVPVDATILEAEDPGPLREDGDRTAR